MSFLRRMYLVLLTLLVFVGVTLFLLVPQTVSNWSATFSEQASVLRILSAVVIDVVLLALLYLQVRPDPRARATGLMMNASGAITEVSVDSARARILKAVSDVPDVVSAEAEVKPVRGRADIELHVTVLGYDVQLPAKQKEINRALNQVIHKQLGLQMAGQPRVHIQFHGEEPVKPSVPSIPLTPSVPVKPVEAPLIPPSPVKPVEPPVSVSKTIEVPVEPEPQKLLGIFGRPKAEVKPEDDEPEADLSAPKVSDIVFKPEPPQQDESKAEDSFTLNLEEEIAGSSTEDIVLDQEKPEAKEPDEELLVKTVNEDDPQKEVNLDNNRV